MLHTQQQLRSISPFQVHQHVPGACAQLMCPDPSSTSFSEPLLLKLRRYHAHSLAFTVLCGGGFGVFFAIIKYFTQVALFMHLQQEGLTAYSQWQYFTYSSHSSEWYIQRHTVSVVELQGNSCFKAELLEPPFLPRKLLHHASTSLVYDSKHKQNKQTKDKSVCVGVVYAWKNTPRFNPKILRELDGIFNCFLFKTLLTTALCTNCLLTRLATQKAPSLQTTVGEDQSTTQNIQCCDHSND